MGDLGHCTIVNLMNTESDPRLSFYFTVDGTGNYSGNAPGKSSSYSAFSKPAGLVKQFSPGDVTDAGRLTYPDFPGDLMDYAEVEFLLAEAIERGFSVDGEQLHLIITAPSLRQFFSGVALQQMQQHTLPGPVLIMQPLPEHTGKK